MRHFVCLNNKSVNNYITLCKMTKKGKMTKKVPRPDFLPISLQKQIDTSKSLKTPILNDYIIVRPGYGEDSGKNISVRIADMDKEMENPDDNLFTFHHLRDNEIEYFGMKFSDEETIFGESVQDAVKFIDDVLENKPTKINFWNDVYTHNQGAMVFTKTHFLYPVFDYGKYYDNEKVPLCEKHKTDLNILKNAMLDPSAPQSNRPIYKKPNLINV